jgi:Tol biopolymer transport system component
MAVVLSLAAVGCALDDDPPATAGPVFCASVPKEVGAALTKRLVAPSRRIIFWRQHPWPSLWSVRPDGSGLRRIYHTRQNAKRPSLSPDRQWLVFDGASPGKAPISDFDIQVVRVDGTQRRTLAESTDWELDAAWSPDGSRLSFERWRRGGEGDDWSNSEIWVVDFDGTNLERLGKGLAARWSPDGQLLVFAAPTAVSDGDLFLMNADGSGRCRLLATPAREYPAGWSPDGKRILFSRWGPDGADVFVVNTDGSGVRNLSRSPGYDFAADWSPDGSQILFTSGQVGGSQEIFVMNADGSGIRRISGDRFRGSDPSWG